MKDPARLEGWKDIAAHLSREWGITISTDSAYRMATRARFPMPVDGPAGRVWASAAAVSAWVVAERERNGRQRIGESMDPIYVQARNTLIPEAERFAENAIAEKYGKDYTNPRVGEKAADRADRISAINAEWTRLFADKMTALWKERGEALYQRYGGGAKAA